MTVDLWKALLGGMLIGAGAAALLLLNGRIAGISGIFENTVTGAIGAQGWRLAFLDRARASRRDPRPWTDPHRRKGCPCSHYRDCWWASAPAWAAGAPAGTASAVSPISRPGRRWLL